MINKHLLAQILAERAKHGQMGRAMLGHAPTFANGPLVSPGPVNNNTLPPPILPMANSKPVGYVPSAPHTMNFAPPIKTHDLPMMPVIPHPKAPAVAHLPKLKAFIKK